ncbi:A/G-specific adenine glycosylase [Methylomonas sp. 2BW1-5-20]|uniref:A/G-specific adenine glycosylase n=1 Tax=Methylomonas sp. 2BW1-5-20 TaxID=3376686 RepID=UPI004052273D
MSPEQFQTQLLAWFDQHGRKDLPWQQDISPYRVWVSEIMLQQTQVVSVIGYFNRFMARFPTVESLAAAELDEVLLYWSGLGYYARARNLHKTAQLLAANQGRFPQTVEDLSALPGIGRSTAGAILSIACGQSQPILDGNVKRVLARFHAVHGWPGDNKVAAELWQISRQYTPQQRTGDYTQAMMDLGATLCTRSKPQCEICPIAVVCRASLLGLEKTLPESKPRKVLPVKQLYFLLLLDKQNRILLEKRPPTGIWGGLWSLPEFADREALQDWCMQYNYLIDAAQTLPSQRHSFSHYHLDYIPLLARLENPINNVMEGERAVWYKTAEINTLGLPTPIGRLLQQHFTEDHNDEND